MTNIQIKKEIEIVTKRLPNFSISLTIWHGDTIEYDHGVYIELSILKGNKIIDNSIDCSSTLEDTKENTIIIKREQEKLYNYLIKHFDNVSIDTEQWL